MPTSVLLGPCSSAMHCEMSLQRVKSDYKHSFWWQFLNHPFWLISVLKMKKLNFSGYTSSVSATSTPEDLGNVPLFFFFKKDYYCVYLCRGGGILKPLGLGLQTTWCGHWKPNSSPMKKQQMILTTEQSLSLALNCIILALSSIRTRIWSWRDRYFSE